MNWKRTRLLVRSNFRKAKGQIAAIIVLMLLSSAMMNLWLMLSMDYEKNFDDAHDRLHDGHFVITAATDEQEFRDYLTDLFDHTEEVTEYDMVDALGTSGSFSYGGGEIMSWFVFMEKETALPRSVGSVEIVEEGGYESGIYLPLLYGMGGNYSVGDTIEISIGGETLSYTVCGFFHSVMAGTHNCAMVQLLLTEDCFLELSEKGCAMNSTFTSVRIGEKAQNEEVKDRMRDEISDAYPNLIINSNCYDEVKTARYISPMICAGILSAMAFFVLLIGVVVISSNVVNMIQEQMQDLGALKAVGYMSRQLIVSLIMQFLGISVVVSAVGCAVSYCIFPALNKMMTAQTGVPYQLRFLALPCLLTIGLISAVVAAAVYLFAKRMRKIDPIAAIRQGVANHNFKKNPVPLNRTRLGIHTALAMKTTLSGLKQNITVFVTMLVISLIMVFSGVMYENMIVDMQPFIDMIAGESADSCINVDADREKEFLRVTAADGRVEKAYLYHNENVQHIDAQTGDVNASLEVTISDDFDKLNNQSVMIEGRFPQYENETAIAAKYARENGLEIGDEIILKAGAGECTYLITGFVQTTNHLGKDCALTRSGYEKIGNLQSVTYYLNLTDQTDIEAFNKEVSELFAGGINSTINIWAAVEGSGSIYVALMTAIVVVVMVLSCLIVIFVMYLLVRTLLNSKKRDYGILKALGYTTGQLVIQTALSFMPSVILSTVAGIAVSARIINPLLAVFLGGLGIVKSTFSVPLWFNIAGGCGLILFAFASACLMSRRVKKITPRELLSGE